MFKKRLYLLIMTAVVTPVSLLGQSTIATSGTSVDGFPIATIRGLTAAPGLLAFIGGRENGGGDGLFLHSAQGLRLVTRTGDRVPGSGDEIVSFSRAALGQAGQLAFVADLGSGDKGLFKADNSGLTEIHVRSQRLGDNEVLDYPEVAVGSDGSVAFVARVYGPSSPAALYVSRGGEISQLVASGDEIDGDRIELPLKLRFGRADTIYFIDYKRVGPVTQYAPAALYAVAKRKVRKVFDATAQLEGLPGKLRIGAGGLGLRSYDFQPDGTLLIVANYDTNDEADFEKQVAFTFDPVAREVKQVFSDGRSEMPLKLLAAPGAPLLLSSNTLPDGAILRSAGPASSSIRVDKSQGGPGALVREGAVVGEGRTCKSILDLAVAGDSAFFLLNVTDQDGEQRFLITRNKF